MGFVCNFTEEARNGTSQSLNGLVCHYLIPSLIQMRQQEVLEESFSIYPVGFSRSCSYNSLMICTTEIVLRCPRVCAMESASQIPSRRNILNELAESTPARDKIWNPKLSILVLIQRQMCVFLCYGNTSFVVT